MLQRKTGRWLLFLLVVTGISGTLRQNILSEKERNDAISLLRTTFQEANDFYRENLSKKSKNTRGISINSLKVTLNHLAFAEKQLTDWLEQCLLKPPHPEKIKDKKFTDEELIQKISVGTISPDVIFSENKKSKQLLPTKKAFHLFKSQRLKNIKYVKITTDDLRNRFIELPFGTADAYQLLLIMSACTKRIIQQTAR
ncbi:MAG: hypothetical protein N2747_09255 [Chitinophagaceae bacterium]|nr:hypothetical protein [Chitinophagaceae bacterium]